jgi:two-component system, sensor histidine kinase PdtaS
VQVTTQATQTLPDGIAPAPGDRTLLTTLGSVLLRPRGQVYEGVFALSAFGVALVVRLAVDDLLPPGFPFLTFFPAVLVTAVFAGLRAGIAVAVLSGVASWYFFISPERSFQITTGTAVALAFFVLIVAAELLFIASTDMALRRLRDVHQQTARLARGRELMMSEMQHRVSNNLATVAALLRAQSGQMDQGPARDALAAAQQRIMTISRLQRRLHRHDQQQVDLGAYLQDIATDAAESAGVGPQVVRLDTVPLKVTQDQALPMGLIVCELLLNAFEHGGTRPDLSVHLTLEPCPGDGDDRVAITIADNGPGLSPDFDLATVDSLGLSVAQQFAVQLDGDLTLQTAPEGGTRARILFRPQRPQAEAA